MLVTIRGYLYSVPYYRANDGTMHLVTAYPDGRRMVRYGLARGQ